MRLRKAAGRDRHRTCTKSHARTTPSSEPAITAASSREKATATEYLLCVWPLYLRGVKDERGA